eukprot:365725-Chlamydomonas_euryale.AAC.29
MRTTATSITTSAYTRLTILVSEATLVRGHAASLLLAAELAARRRACCTARPTAAQSCQQPAFNNTLSQRRIALLLLSACSQLQAGKAPDMNVNHALCSDAHVHHHWVGGACVSADGHRIRRLLWWLRAVCGRHTGGAASLMAGCCCVFICLFQPCHAHIGCLSPWAPAHLLPHFRSQPITFAKFFQMSSIHRPESWTNACLTTVRGCSSLKAVHLLGQHSPLMAASGWAGFCSSTWRLSTLVQLHTQERHCGVACGAS